MFIMSVKVNKKAVKWVILAVAACIIAAGLLIALRENSAGSLAAMQEHGQPEEYFEAAEAMNPSGKIKSDEDRLRYIEGLGWKVADEQPCEVIEVRIPEEFDEVYTAYNEMQKAAGYDLEKYQGKRVKRWSFYLADFMGKPENTVKINLLEYKNKIIGGDICETAADGFLYGLKGPQ